MGPEGPGRVRKSELLLIVGLLISISGTAASQTDPDAISTRKRVEMLQSVLRGEVPESGLEELVGVDLSDAEAVRRRREQLAAQLEDAVPTSSTSTTSAEWRRRSIELQLAFLDKPKSFRDAVVAAEAARLRAERERAAATARAEAAARAAEAAQREKQRALEESRRARTAQLRALEARRAELAAWRVELAKAQGRISARTRDRSASRSEASRAIQGLVSRVLQARSSTAAETVYRAAQAQWIDASRELGSVLTRRSAGLDLPAPPGLGPLPATAGSTVAEALGDRIREARLEGQALRSELEALAHQNRMTALRSWSSLLDSAALARSTALERSTTGFRAAQIGWTQTGLANLRLELAAARRALLARARLWLDELERPGLQMERSELFRRGWPWLESFGVVLLALWLASRVEPLRERIRRAQSGARSLTKLRRLQAWDRALARFAGPVLFVLACEVIARVLRADERGVEPMAVLVLARWFGLYWLTRRLLDSVVLWLARRGRRSLPRRLRQDIEQSVLRATLAVIVAGAARQLARLFFGTSALANLVDAVVLAGLALAFLALVRRWRTSIAKAYLSAFPEGRLARAVERYRDRTIGLLVVLFAFVVVSVRSGVQLAREALLGFEQIRRALAFLFRLRLQRTAEETVDVETETNWELPPKIRDAFTLDPVEDDALRVDRFPALDDVVSNPTRTTLIVADVGLGKTTWLLRYAARSDAPPLWVDCGRPGRSAAADAVIAHLAGRAERPAWSGDAPPARVVVDDLHRLLVRAPGGLEPLIRLLSWTEAPDGPAEWVVAMHAPFWRWAAAARPDRVAFRRQVELEPWTEEEIRLLLMARAAASGVVHDFGALVTDATNEEAIARSGEGFTRLIWDTADGSPRVALSEWCRSLSPVGPDRVRIRLSRGPETAKLSTLGERDWWTLATIVQHNGATASTVARALRIDEGIAASILIRLVDLSLLVCEDDGRHRPSLRWERLLDRAVRRRHLL